jgi:hypothetical protein
MLKNRYRIAIAHGSRFGIHGSDTIAQEGLRSRDIQDFFLPPTPVPTRDKRRKKEKSNNLWEKMSRKELHD